MMPPAPDPAPRHVGTLSNLLPTDDVTQGYREGLAWQYHRLQEIADQLEREKDALRAERFAIREERLALTRERQAFAEMAERILSAASQRLLEQELWETVEELERKERRWKKFPHPGGFDAKKAVGK